MIIAGWSHGGVPAGRALRGAKAGILGHLGLRDRVQAALYAREHGVG